MNQFVKKYKQLRYENLNPMEALGLTALHIESKGTMQDLNEVQKVYSQDFLNEWDKLMKEENINEKNTIVEFKIG